VAKLPQISEADFQSQVIQLARTLGWRVAHFRVVRVQRRDGSIRYMTPVQADGTGFPDLVLCRDRVIFAELKAERGRTSPEQDAWLDALAIGAGALCYLWRPSDWNEICEVLK
jgi:hypothetical protein